jgi:hypothetical protein
MQYLKQFLAFLFSRQMLAFLAMVLLALAIWFIGPCLPSTDCGPGGGRRASHLHRAAAGARHPLAGFGSLQPGGRRRAVPAGVACGPAAGHRRRQAAGPGWRARGVIGTILLAVRSTGSIACGRPCATTKICSPRFLSFGRDAGKARRQGRDQDRHRRVTRAGAAQGLARPRRTAPPLRGQALSVRVALVHDPGQPGAGKTTALLNAGLQFPLARQMGNASKRMVFKSEGGTCMRLVVHQRGRADRHRRPLHHAGEQSRDRSGRVARLSRPAAQAPHARTAQRRDRCAQCGRAADHDGDGARGACRHGARPAGRSARGTGHSFSRVRRRHQDGPAARIQRVLPVAHQRRAHAGLGLHLAVPWHEEHPRADRRRARPCARSWKRNWPCSRTGSRPDCIHA